MLALFVVVCFVALAAVASPAGAQSVSNDAFTFKVYATNYGFYPFVQAYMRTFDKNGEPLQNINYANIGIMVKGRIYDPQKVDIAKRQAQYSIANLEQRNEGFRTVIVWDCSLSMKGQPFMDARTAISKFIQSKRPNDQVAILAVRDTTEGYQVISPFDKDSGKLLMAIEDVRCDGTKTRLYDSVGAALEMCATASQGNASGQASSGVCILSSVVVMSDGFDEGSAVARGELISKINTLKTPAPVYSLAYSNADPAHFKNLEAISKASFGKYWTVKETQEFASVLQKIHQINRSDYVVTFRAYAPVDGEKHAYKIGLEYPASSGTRLFQAGEFEAIDPTPALMADPEGQGILAKLESTYPALEDANPYMGSAASLAPAQAAALKAKMTGGAAPAAVNPAVTAPASAQKKTK